MNAWEDSMPTPNIPLLRKVLEHVELEAAKTDNTSDWYQENWRVLGYEVGRDCKSAFCFAGWVCELDPDTQWASNDPGDDHFDDVIANSDIDESTHLPIESSEAGIAGQRVTIAANRARVLLGITEDEAGPLFAAFNEIDQIQEMVALIAARAGEKL